MRLLEIDERTYKLAENLTRRSGISVEQAIADAVEVRASTGPSRAILGLFADEPELIDQVEAWAMEAREAHPASQAPRA